MSAKAAWANGYGPEEFERGMIQALQAIDPQASICYRPKPSWNQARPLPGAEYSAPKDSFDSFLSGAKIVLSHHSNVLVDALIRGIPSIVAAKSPAYNFGNVENGLAEAIATCYVPSVEDRRQWLANLCYQQWKPSELVDGTYLKIFQTLELL